MSLQYDDQLDDAAPIQGTQMLASAAVCPHRPRPVDRSGSGRVALLYAVGTIASGESSFDSPTGAVLGSDTFVEWVRKVRVDPNIAAVVVRVDSPGGSAIASEVIWRELMLTREVKPLVVSMGDVAASGGYYIAAPAHSIVAQPGTLTGSIGVVTGKFVLEGGLDKLGVGTRRRVSDGRSAEIYSPFRPFSNDERARLEEQMRADLRTVRQACRRGPAADDGGRGCGGAGARLERDNARVSWDWSMNSAASMPRFERLRSGRVSIRRAASMSWSTRRSGRSTTCCRTALGATRPGSTRCSGVPTPEAMRAAASVMQLFRRGEPLAILPNVFVR